MTDPMEDLDTSLLAHFHREGIQPQSELFVDECARRVASARARRTLAIRTAQGVALAVLILVSPWLISFSSLMSMQLDTLLGTATEHLFTLEGTAAVLFLGLLGVVLARARRIRRLD